MSQFVIYPLAAPIILSDYQAGCSGRHAQHFLEDWQGHLLVDDYGGYKALFSEKQPRPSIELACWAHARRKFFDLHKANNSPMTLKHCITGWYKPALRLQAAADRPKR